MCSCVRHLVYRDLDVSILDVTLGANMRDWEIEDVIDPLVVILLTVCCCILLHACIDGVIMYQKSKFDVGVCELSRPRPSACVPHRAWAGRRFREGSAVLLC